MRFDYLPPSTLLAGLATAYFTSRASEARTARRMATGGGLVTLGFALAASAFAPTSGALRSLSLLSNDGPIFGLDGLSAPLFPFVAALTLAVTASTSNREASNHRLSGQLLMGAMNLGVLAARRGDVFALFWLGSALPLVRELRGRRERSTFVIAQLIGALFVVGSLALGPTAHRTSTTSDLLLLLGVAVRSGLVPFHSWVPALFETASVGSSIVFVHSQLGSYLLARDLVLHPEPKTALAFDAFAGVTLLYGAALALGQRSARRGLGYLAVSQSALVLVGLADGGALGAAGAVGVMVASGLAQAGFGLAIGALEARRGRARLDQPQGGFALVPTLAGATLLLGLAAAGLPGTLQFVAEDVVFNTTLEARPWVAVAMIAATAANGATILRYCFLLFGGRKLRTGELDLTRRERWVLGAIGAALFGLGFFPHALLAHAKTSLDHRPPSAAAAPASSPAVHPAPM